MNHPAQDPTCQYWTDGDADTPVFQHPGEFNALLDLFSARAPRRVLEVGVYFGGTLKQWLKSGAHCVAVDLFRPHYDPRGKPWARGATFIQGDSRDATVMGSARALGPYDWVYIDAGHRYEEARADWLNYGPMCAPGGVVVLHDIVADPRYHPEIEVPRLWAEIKATHRTTEFVDDYGAKWGGLGVVHL